MALATCACLCLLYCLFPVYGCYGIMNAFPSPSEVFCNKNKTVLGMGDILKFPKLAETMETIAEQGADAFYTGQIGLDLIQDVKAAGGSEIYLCK